MDVDLELTLDERGPDRVFLQVCLRSRSGAPCHVDGATVQLVDAEGQELCPRTLLPLTGVVRQPTALSVELRAVGEMPAGARVVATCWSGAEQVQVDVPAEPIVRLSDHVRGAQVGLPDPDDVLLEAVRGDRRAGLAARHPWLDRPVRTAGPVAVLEARDAPTADDLAEDHGLDDETAQWLEDLLDEPEL